MIDMEKVIAGLTMLADRTNDDVCEELKCCKIAEDVLALLKEQEPVEPKRKDMSHNDIDWFCGKCGHCVRRLDNYCSRCGRKVKWNE